ncbi:hypothetical protein BG74_03200 [Sodalis-like endosymbiont of Proechinophthirus fluctus]|uniref:Sec-independent protein translocase protein TatB n=1 Tax=Sodalis-like endosymbiont of Proechinophthirus fluctus TaxID=1462730 RepID=UPI0007A8484B|nr:Sec-independent protein translocase protein TatB [Sodalis-like endosymbiont of Proechinophthirus fluctus]KYP97410.1 hypothetical protein BG74_03200 [Sodalis-like endosymbiont of Proechinophthirus fluctus]
MFDIGFGELMLVFVIGLVVLGPERLPVAARMVASWIRAIRSIASTVQNELTQEFKLQELQDSLKKVEEASKNNLSPEIKSSMEELREAAESMKKQFKAINSAVMDQIEPHTIHNPLVTDPEALYGSVIPAEDDDLQVDASPMTPADSVANPAVQPEKPSTKAPAQADPGGVASAPRPASSTYLLNNDR